MKDRWPLIEKLFSGAIELEAQEQASFLDRECQGDAALKEDVEALIRAHREAGSFLRPEAAALSGKTFGSYEVKDWIGSGGMGDVYRAHDSKLKRDVAIKVLPEEFSRNAQRIARFQREAEVLASLNHPHIAAIYDLAEFDESRFLILEFVEGETLADRLTRGPVAMEDALHIAAQIAEAVEAAHEKGIIHRDLKPANIKITPDGNVKVLDFGLAKVRETPGAVLSKSPAMTVATAPGMIFGTAAYMSPEQAQGKDADRTSDVWAFGCVLYEMLTGKRPFDGDSVTEILANVLRGDPDWKRLPADTPESVRRALRRCLEKQQRLRLHDVADVRIELEDMNVRDSPRRASLDGFHLRKAQILWIAVAAVFMMATAALLTLRFRDRSSEKDQVLFRIPAPEGTTFEAINSTATGGYISPDGKNLAFTAYERFGEISPLTTNSNVASSLVRVLVWVRPLDNPLAKPLEGTNGAATGIFWSPDSRSIGFFADGKLKTVEIAGGIPRTLCDAQPPRGGGGSWARDGTIIFATARPGEGLQRVSSSGGDVMTITKLAAGQTAHRFPFFLPDGRRFLYAADGPSEKDVGVFFGSLDSPETHRLVSADSAAIYGPPGYLLFVRQGTLLAQRFDADRLNVSGEVIRLAESVPFDLNFPDFSASNTGALTYRSGPYQDLQFAWYSRSGALIDPVGPPGAYRGVDLSPDGKRIAVHRHDANGGDIWVMEPRGTMTRVTLDPSRDSSSPIWSPDGSQIVYGALRDGKWGLYRKTSDGRPDEEKLMESDLRKIPSAWARDGDIIYWLYDRDNGIHQWRVPHDNDHAPIPLFNSRFNEMHPQVSPDGKWVAYSTAESGTNEVYVAAFPMLEGRRQVSLKGGVFPRWRGDSKEIFYKSAYGGGTFMAIAFKADGATFQLGEPQELFPDFGSHTLLHLGFNYHSYAVSPDGQRFLIARPVSDFKRDIQPTPITVVLHWAAALKD